MRDNNIPVVDCYLLRYRKSDKEQFEHRIYSVDERENAYENMQFLIMCGYSARVTIVDDDGYTHLRKKIKL